MFDKKVKGKQGDCCKRIKKSNNKVEKYLKKGNKCSS